jgi:hypothetical protein
MLFQMLQIKQHTISINKVLNFLSGKKISIEQNQIFAKIHLTRTSPQTRPQSSTDYFCDST